MTTKFDILFKFFVFVIGNIRSIEVVVLMEILSERHKNSIVVYVVVLQFAFTYIIYISSILVVVLSKSSSDCYNNDWNAILTVFKSPKLLDCTQLKILDKCCLKTSSSSFKLFPNLNLSL